MDPNVNTDLVRAYILKKFIPALEKDLRFAKFAHEMLPSGSFLRGLPPVPWHRRLRYRVTEYFSRLWTALRGRDRECPYCLDENDY